MKKDGVTNEEIMSYLVDMNEQIIDIRSRVATKEDLEMLRQEIREELRPFSVALDRDAETIIGHGKRIAILESKAGVTAK